MCIALSLRVLTEPNIKRNQSRVVTVEKRQSLPRVSTPCKSLTKTFCCAIRLAAIDRRRVTTEGKPSGTNATRIETAKVTVVAAFPLYTVVIPTTKKIIAKEIAMQETMTTKRPLFLFSGGRGQREGRIHTFQLQEGFHSHSRLRSYWRFVLADVNCKSRRMSVYHIPINVWSPVLATTINVLNKHATEMSQWPYLPTLLRLLSGLN